MYMIRAKNGINKDLRRIVKPECPLQGTSAKLLHIYLMMTQLYALNPEFNHHPLGNITRIRRPSKFSHQNGLRCWRPSQSRPSKMGTKILRRDGRIWETFKNLKRPGYTWLV